MSDRSTATPPRGIDFSEFLLDPHGCLARHRHDGWWAPLADMDAVEVLAHDSVRELLTRDDVLAPHTSALMSELVEQNPNVAPELRARMQEVGVQGLIDLDGDEHFALRSLVARWFTPSAVAAISPRIRAAAELLGWSLKPGDDFMATFARELPALSLSALFDIPIDDHRQVFEWVDRVETQLSAQRLLTLTFDESHEVLDAELALDRYARELVDRRRAAPGTDLLSKLLLDTERSADDATIAMLLRTMIFAGNDTTRCMLGLAMRTLADHPDVWERMSEHPETVDRVVEELLRFTPPGPGVVRRARCSFEHKDRQFDEGEVVLLSTWSANRDEEAFGFDAASFDAERPDANAHVAFGRGRHFCLGANIAREELRAALSALTRQLTEIAVVGEPTMRAPGGIYGPTTLRLRFERRVET